MTSSQPRHDARSSVSASLAAGYFEAFRRAERVGGVANPVLAWGGHVGDHHEVPLEPLGTVGGQEAYGRAAHALESETEV